MTGSTPVELAIVHPDTRTYPASYRDAAIRIAYDSAKGGVPCSLCGQVARSLLEKQRLQSDHIHPYALGGRTTWENLQLLCGPCNLKKGARLQW